MGLPPSGQPLATGKPVPPALAPVAVGQPVAEPSARRLSKRWLVGGLAVAGLFYSTLNTFIASSPR
jgi:hypothetical protein